jgi:hypothetical protein
MVTVWSQSRREIEDGYMEKSKKPNLFNRLGFDSVAEWQPRQRLEAEDVSPTSSRRPATPIS